MKRQRRLGLFWGNIKDRITGSFLKCSPNITILHEDFALIFMNFFLFFQNFSKYEGPHQYGPKRHVGRAISEVG